MRMQTVEISVGAFVLAGILALVFLAIKVSGVSLGDDPETYRLQARFDDVGGLRLRAKIRMAGVTIGRVTKIEVDMEYGEAIVTLDLNGPERTLTVDTAAQILTEGILGARYVNLLPGADSEMLTDGDSITETQGAMILENLVSELITRIGD